VVNYIRVLVKSVAKDIGGDTIGLSASAIWNDLQDSSSGVGVVLSPSGNI
jgi:hypothetical protein